MNTRQKLTLGIAAIFMVTLTVIGVTYAYFVTRINYTNGTATAVIETATIGSSYQDDNQLITLSDILPGQVVYKTFAVNNASDVPVSFAVTLASKLNIKGCIGAAATTESECTGAGGTWSTDAMQQFVHSTLGTAGTCTVADKTTKAECDAVSGTWTPSLVEECYVSASYEDNDDSKPTACYNATTYDNILVELYRVENYTNGKDAYINTTTNNPNAGTCSDTNYTTQMTCQAAGKTWEYNVEEWNTCTYKSDGTIDTSSCSTENIYKVPVTTNATYGLEAREVAYCDSTSAVCNPINLNHKNNTILETVEKKQTNGDETSNLYLLKITYVNVNKNQNIENKASVSVKVDISATYATAITPNIELGA